MKPIGYYVSSYTPGDGGILQDMEEAWGSTFEQLNEAERTWMIYRLGYLLWIEAEGDVDDSVEEAMRRADSELTVGDKIGLLDALINQLKYMCRHAL